MGRIGPAQARNAIKRALYGILYPYPSKAQINRVWEFFESHCAYCGKLLNRDRREGHLDHLTSVTRNASAHRPVFVLACGECNGDQKREKDWETYLTEIDRPPKDIAARRVKILEWAAMADGLPIDSNIAEQVEQHTESALAAFNKAQEAIQLLKPASRKPQE